MAVFGGPLAEEKAQPDVAQHDGFAPPIAELARDAERRIEVSARDVDFANVVVHQAEVGAHGTLGDSIVDAVRDLERCAVTRAGIGQAALAPGDPAARRRTGSLAILEQQWA